MLIAIDSMQVHDGFINTLLTSDRCNYMTHNQTDDDSLAKCYISISINGPDISHYDLKILNFMQKFI